MNSEESCSNFELTNGSGRVLLNIVGSAWSLWELNNPLNSELNSSKQVAYPTASAPAYAAGAFMIYRLLRFEGVSIPWKCSLMNSSRKPKVM